MHPYEDRLSGECLSSADATAYAEFVVAFFSTFAARGVKKMGSCIWFGKMALITVLSLFFLMFGIENMIGAFHLKNPAEFIMYFFSTSLMILLSIVGLLYPAFKFHARFSLEKNTSDEK